MSTKILFFHEAFEIGGDTVYLKYLLSAFGRSEYELLLSGCPECFDFLDKTHFNVVTCHSFSRDWVVHQIRRQCRWRVVRAVLFRLDQYLLNPVMRRLVWPFRMKRRLHWDYPDCPTLVINSGGFPAEHLAALLRVFPGARCCILHNHVPRSLTPDSPISIRLKTDCDHWIVGSHVISTELTECCGIPPEKVSVIRYGVPAPPPYTAEDRLRVRARLGIGADTFLVLHPSVFQERKGHGFTVNGFRGFKQRHADSKLVFAGDGNDLDYIERVEAVVREAGVGGDTLFTGFYTPIEELIYSSDVLCLPSQDFETTPLVILTALAYGVPVVTTSRPDFEGILNETNSFLVPTGDSVHIGERLAFIADNPVTARAIADNGKGVVAQHFSFERMLSQTAGVLQQLQNRRETLDDCTAPHHHLDAQP